MTEFNPHWIYFGHLGTQVNANWQSGTTAEARATSLEEAQAGYVGLSATGSQMQGVQMSLSSVGNSTTVMRGSDPVRYTLQGETQTTTVYTSHAVVNITFETARANELAPGGVETGTVSLRGVVIQTEAGDLFIRPYYLDTNGWNDTLGSWSISRVTIDSVATGLNPADSNTDRYTNGLAGEAGFNPSFFDDSLFVCFAAGTMVATPDGPRRIEDLRPGDLVDTLDHGPRPLRWIGRRQLPSELLQRRPALCPVRILADAFGPGAPASDLVVSPQHRILLRGPTVSRMFGQPQVLVAAKEIAAMDGFARSEPAEAGADYVHLLFDDHEIVIANGMASESLLLGPQAMLMMGHDARSELLAIFPEAATGVMPAARQIVRGKRARSLLRRQMSKLSRQKAAVRPPARKQERLALSR